MYLFNQYVLIVAGVLAAALAVVFVLQQRRTPQSAAAWILFIIVMPYVGIPIFLMLGFRKQGSRFPAIQFSEPAAPPAEDYSTAETLARLGAPAATAGNGFVLHDTAERALAELDAVIAGATVSLDLQFYILDNDSSGRRLVRLLAEKAREGVAVRLILDRLGTLTRPRRALAEFTEAGGQLRFFSPFVHPPDNGHMNLRNHRKLVIADNSVVWGGGRNIGDVYLAPPEGRWLDLSFTVTGPVVQHFLDVFASDWDVRGHAQQSRRARWSIADQDAVLQLVPSGPDEPGDVLHDGLTNAIHNARRRVWIATPYLVPTEAHSAALAVAARRGVEVRLLIPDRSNKWSADHARGPYLRELGQAGCRVFRYSGGMLHAKAGLIDDTAWVGSANFDVRSMLLNFELALFVYDAGSVGALERWAQGLAERSTEGLTEAGLPRRVLEGLFRLGAPVL
ncbi:Major cardiolipin synthase ClsA [Defluviimonas aquaemixtae]|uniref:Phospholipase D n=1 Tax=Albidovulum aquaemixtae TaxID=1542388 RepID=A0A2R8B857_9RHOB|nr:phospholipase D-like domain-containing protein [Defluviimonas aquaemixtae]SPH18830.1 Major cardiolipin synthase ClsA [Defluviimonas aquaemixtae]